MSPVTFRREIGVLDSMTVLKTPDLTYGGTVGINGSADDTVLADLFEGKMQELNGAKMRSV